MRIVRVLAYTILCISGAGFETAAARACSAEAHPLRRAEMPAPDAMQAETTVKELFQPQNNEFTDWIGDVRLTVVRQNLSVASFLSVLESTHG